MRSYCASVGSSLPPLFLLPNLFIDPQPSSLQEITCTCFVCMQYRMLSVGVCVHARMSTRCACMHAYTNIRSTTCMCVRACARVEQVVFSSALSLSPFTSANVLTHSLFFHSCFSAHRERNRLRRDSKCRLSELPCMCCVCVHARMSVARMRACALLHGCLHAAQPLSLIIFPNSCYANVDQCILKIDNKKCNEQQQQNQNHRQKKLSMNNKIRITDKTQISMNNNIRITDKKKH